MTKSLLASLLLLTGCSSLLGEPERQQFCYHRPSGEHRCFHDERALSADVYREQLATVLAVEEQAKQGALAVVAERDALEAAARARTTVDRSDRVQNDAFEILVEMREDAQERERLSAASASPSAAPSPVPQTPPDQ